MQDTKTHQAPARLMTLFRVLLTAAAVLGLLLAMTPGALAAGTPPQRPQSVIPLGRCIRPSGTEPKIKLYVNTNAKDQETSAKENAELVEACKQMLQ